MLYYIIFLLCFQYKDYFSDLKNAVILQFTVLSRRFFSPRTKTMLRRTGRMGKAWSLRHRRAEKRINASEIKTALLPKIVFTIAPPSRGITGIRLKSARDKFSTGKIPRINIRRLNAGPAENIIRLCNLPGTEDRLIVQPQG